MKIGICDDEPIIAKMLIQLVEQSLIKLKMKSEIKSYLSGCSLIEDIDDIDAVFLDIDMPEMDGFEVGRGINKRNPNCKIIMATGKVERFKESFKINAFRFVTKPFVSSEIDEVIEALIKLRIGEETIPLYFNRIQYGIQQKNIKYLKAYNGYSEAVVEDKYFRKDLSLNEVEELLDNRLFVRVHKQYIVNMHFVKEYKSCKITIDDIEIPISRRKKKEFEKMFIDFDISYGG